MDKIIQKNGFTRKELILLRPFIREPWREFTLSEIKKISQNRSHHYVFEALKRYSAMEVLLEKRKGNTNTYIINENASDFRYLAFAESLIKEERIDIPYAKLINITEKIDGSFYILLVGGSYADKKQKPSSDLDVAMIIPNAESKKPYETALRDGEYIVPEVHGYVFSQEEFYSMLINKEFNYGKELARKHILVYGAEAYYKILLEAMKNGFKG